MTNHKKKPLNQFLKFSNIAIQMGIIIGLSAYGGQKIDQRYNFDNLFSLVFSLIGVFCSLYIVIRGVKRI